MLQARSGILFRWRDAHGLGFQTALSETGSRTRWEAAGWIRSGGPPLTRAAAAAHSGSRLCLRGLKTGCRR